SARAMPHEMKIVITATRQASIGRIQPPKEPPTPVTYAAMNLAEKLRSLNIALPPVSGPFGSYIPAKRVGNLIYVAGQLPMKDGKLMATGQVPSRCSIEQAKLAARQCVINALGAIQSIEGSIDHLTGVAR